MNDMADKDLVTPEIMIKWQMVLEKFYPNLKIKDQ